MVKVLRSTVLPAPVDAVWEIIRDFNGHDRWHPAVADSHIERGEPVDRVGCVRRFHLAGGEELREQLLTLSDIDMAFSYCLLDTEVPLFNYVAHVRLFPITDGDHTFWQWESRFDTRPGEDQAMADLVATNVSDAGFEAIREHMGLAA
jgi:hypothetical protein